MLSEQEQTPKKTTGLPTPLAKAPAPQGRCGGAWESQGSGRGQSGSPTTGGLLQRKAPQWVWQHPHASSPWLQYVLGTGLLTQSPFAPRGVVCERGQHPQRPPFFFLQEDGARGVKGALWGRPYRARSRRVAVNLAKVTAGHHRAGADKRESQNQGAAPTAPYPMEAAAAVRSAGAGRHGRRVVPPFSPRVTLPNPSLPIPPPFRPHSPPPPLACPSPPPGPPTGERLDQGRPLPVHRLHIR